MPVQLTVDASYSGGLEAAIADCTTAGRDASDPYPVLALDEDVYPDEEIGAANASLRGPSEIVKRLIIRPVRARESVAIGDLVLDGTNYLGFHGTRHATAIMDGPTTRTLPIHDTDGVTINAGIKLTPVVTNLPVPRVRLMNYWPKAADQSEDLVVTVERRDITISGVSTDANKRVTTTAAAVIDAINNSSEAAALVTASVKDGQDGSGHVQDGFPFWHAWGGGWREVEVSEGTHDVDIVRCKLGTVRQLEGSYKVRVQGCYYPTGSFALTHSVSQGDRRIYWTHFDRNIIHSGYNTDCVGPRPAHAVCFTMDDCVIHDGRDPEASSLHMDTWQPIFGCSNVKIRRNRITAQSGQCFFMTNFLCHEVLIENNLIHQDGEANLTCQLGAVINGIVRFNTLIVNGWLWDDSDTEGELSQGLLVYNNITKRFSRATGVPVGHDYNIVETAGTGWASGANETSTLPQFASPLHPNWDYHYIDTDQPGVGDGTAEFRGHRSPATDLMGSPRDPETVDQGCYVAA